MSVAVLFIVAINWNQPKCPSVRNEEIAVYLHNGILHVNKNISHCYMQQHKKERSLLQNNACYRIAFL